MGDTASNNFSNTQTIPKKKKKVKKLRKEESA